MMVWINLFSLIVCATPIVVWRLTHRPPPRATIAGFVLLGVNALLGLAGVTDLIIRLSLPIAGVVLIGSDTVRAHRALKQAEAETERARQQGIDRVLAMLVDLEGRCLIYPEFADHPQTAEMRAELHSALAVLGVTDLSVTVRPGPSRRPGRISLN
jgi:hypothetical protein